MNRRKFIGIAGDSSDDTDIGRIINKTKAESINREQRKYSIYPASGLFEELSAAGFTTPTCRLVYAEMMGNLS